MLVDYAHSWMDGTLFVWCQTDIPCHLWLRWTDKEERMHLTQKERRGATHMSDPYYCFVEWNEVEQNEPGDTTTHTFNFSGWVECIRRWWFLHGTEGDIESPSTSAIFTAHAFDQEDAMSLKHTDLIEKEVDGVIDHADHSIPNVKLQTPPIWEFRQVITLTAPAGQITFSAIGEEYSMLRLTGFLRGDVAAHVVLRMFFNGDYGNHYNTEVMTAQMAACSCWYHSGNYIHCGTVHSSVFSVFEALIQNLLGSAHRLTHSRTGYPGYSSVCAGRWEMTSHIQELELSPGTGVFQTGSKLIIEGTKL